MAKKIINKNVFLCHDKRAEISTKNLVTFNRRDGVNDKKFYYYGTSLKNPGFFRGGGGGGCINKFFLGGGRSIA